MTTTAWRPGRRSTPHLRHAFRTAHAEAAPLTTRPPRRKSSLDAPIGETRRREDGDSPSRERGLDRAESPTRIVEIADSPRWDARLAVVKTGTRRRGNGDSPS